MQNRCESRGRVLCEYALIVVSALTMCVAVNETVALKLMIAFTYIQDAVLLTVARVG